MAQKWIPARQQIVRGAPNHPRIKEMKLNLAQLFLVSALLIPACATAQPRPELARPGAAVTAAEFARNPILGQNSKRVGRITLDRSLLLEATAAAPIGRAPNIALELFKGERVVAIPRPTSSYRLDDHSLYADVLGDSDGFVSISWNGDRLYGSVQSFGRHYTVWSGRDGETFVKEIDFSTLPPDGEPVGGDESHKYVRSKASTTAKASSERTVDLLVLYTPSVAARYDTTLLVNNAAATMNASFANTSVDMGVRIVGYRQVNYSEAGRTMEGVNVDLRANGSSNPPLNEHDPWREVLQADVVVLIVDSSQISNICGVTTTPTEYGPLDPSLVERQRDKAYVVLGDACVTPSNTFAHEIGHALSGLHQRSSSDSGQSNDQNDTPPGMPAPGANHGFIDGGSGFRSIMAVGSSCTVSNCARANRWSSNQSGYGAGDADMKSALDAFVLQAVGYESNGDAAPSAAPSPLSLEVLCYSYLAHWSAPAGTVGWYELFTADNGAFTGQTIQFRGPELEALVPVSSTTYFRGRACNANGCGPYSNTASGTAQCP